MKKIISIVILVLSIRSSFAQVSYGVQGAAISSSHANFSTLFFAQPKTLISWKAGGMATIPASKHFALMPQLNVVVKGGKSSYNDEMNHDQYTEKLTYLELPVYALYTSSKLDHASFFIGGGPVLSRGISGRFTGHQDHAGTTPVDVSFRVRFDGATNVGNDPDIHYKPWEFAIGLIGGYRLLNGLILNAHYNLTSMGGANNNYYAGFGVGYMFKQK